MAPNPTSAVNPSQESIAALSEWPDDGPIAMLNLLRFDGESGRASYGRYGEVAARSIAAVGGSLIYMAPVIDPTDTWDSVALVFYPRRAAYLDMQNDPDYVAAISERSAGLDARLLYPFALPNGSGMKAASLGTPKHDEVVAIQLIHWNDLAAAKAAGHDHPDTSNGELVVRLAAGGPGLVTDGPWHELRLVRYPSVDLWDRDAPPLVASGRGSADVLTVLTQPQK
jgi:uncharacterized protein (DUF1330 family)